MIGRGLVVVEQRDGVITPGQLGVLASARAVSGSVEVLVFGPPTSDAVDLLGQHGAQVIHVAAGDAVTTSVALPRVELIGHLQSQQPFDAIQHQLDAFLHEHGVDAPVTHRWGGTMGFSHDGLPYLGRAADGIYRCGGFTGHGNGLYSATFISFTLPRKSKLRTCGLPPMPSPYTPIRLPPLW